MTSPWNIDDKAFAPMYEEPLLVRHTDGGKTVDQTLMCIVFSDATGEAISAEAMDTEREDITISFRARDWAFVQSLKRGDKVARPTTNGKTYAVQEVKYDAVMGWVISARGV